MIRRQLPVHSPLTLGSIFTAFRSVFGHGSPPEELRRLLAQRFEAEQVILFGSGTQALTAAISAALEQTGSDRPVALPAYACYDVASAAVGADARIILYDLDPETLSPDWDSVQHAVEDGAGTVVLAPFYGYPFDWRPADRLAARYNIELIEDAAQAAGGEWEGSPAGTFGGMTILSFGRGKGWTGGRGGALLARGPAIPARLPSPPAPPMIARIRSAAAVVAQWALARPSVYGLPRSVPWLHLGETRYHPPGLPNSMLGFSAALALATEELARAEIETRRENGRELTRALGSIPNVVPIRIPAEAVPGFLRVPCRILDSDARRRVIEVCARFGLEPGYPTTLAALEPVRDRLSVRIDPGSIPGARTLADELVTLPTHGLTRTRDRESMMDCLVRQLSE